MGIYDGNTVVSIVRLVNIQVELAIEIFFFVYALLTVAMSHTY